MKLRTLYILALALLLCASCRGKEEGVAKSRIPRRVFLITVDTLRADHMSLYGYGRATSPRLDGLALTGVTFDQAICQWPKTGSSFASMFTGMYPHTTGITHRAAVRIPEPYLTLPELFQESGYETVGVVSNAVLASEFGWNTGFDDFAETWGGGEFPEDPKRFRPLASAPKVNETALPLLRKHAGAERLFAWIHYTDPHAPYMLPDGTKNPFVGDALFDQGDRPLPAKKVNPGYRLDEREDLKYYVAHYDANVLVVDEHIRKLLAEMRSLGLLEDSLIVFTADHGESLGEHNSWFEHGPLPYNTTARVPLFFVMEGMTAGRRVDRPVELVDLYPTLRDLAAPGREVPGLEGRSLLSFLRQGEPEGQQAAAFRQAFSGAGRRPNLYHSVQEPTWKLVFNSGRRSRAAASSTGGFELYNLVEDPLESRNLAALHREEVRRLRRNLVDWMKKARATGEDEEPNAETERALRALGYLN